MSFDKYISHRKIEKTVDPGNGDLPSSLLLKKDRSETPEAAKAVVKTSLSTLVQDIIEESQAIQREIYDTIDEIVETSKSDSSFVRYTQMVKDNHFNPVALLRNPSSRPTIKHLPNTIKAAERDVYNRVVDPRAPFVQDLYDHAADAGLTEYVLTSYWKKMVEPNDLYDVFDGEHTAPKLALGKEAQHLRQLRDSANRIKRNKLQQLSYGFIRAFSDRISSRVYSSIPKEQIAQIDNIIQLLKQLRTILTVVSIFNAESWEKFVSNLKDIAGDSLQVIATKVTRTAAYPFIAGIQDKVLDFIDGFEEILPFDLEIADIPEAQDFVNQIHGCFGTFMAQIEDDLVYREGIQIKLEENRQILIANSQKNSSTKQFIQTINSAIQFLEEFKSLLENMDRELAFNIATLSEKLIQGLGGYSESVSIVKDSPQEVKDDVNKYNA
jgi:hypothetical protein